MVMMVKREALVLSSRVGYLLNYEKITGAGVF